MENSMVNFWFRNYENGDFPAIKRLWTRLGLGGNVRGDDETVIERTLEANGALFLVFDGSSLVGTAWMTNDHRRLHLHHMGIDEAYQNKGLGMLLLRHCLGWARKTGLQLKLEVHTDNSAALHLYKKAGFKRLGDYDVYIMRDYDDSPH